MTDLVDGIPRLIMTRAQHLVWGGLLRGPQPYRWLLRQAQINGIDETELLGAGWFWGVLWWQDEHGETVWSLPYESRRCYKRKPRDDDRDEAKVPVAQPSGKA